MPWLCAWHRSAMGVCAPHIQSHLTHHEQRRSPRPETGLFSALNPGRVGPLIPSPMSSAFDVSHIAELARLQLSAEETAKFQAQLGDVLAYVEKLEKVDVSGVEPTAHANAVFNVFREDAPRDWFEPKDALANAPRTANQLFIVPKVIE